MLNNGFDHEQVMDMRYEAAREKLKEFHGVGDKVADCVALFSLGFHEAYPLDTWAQKTVRRHYPEHHADSYQKTSENLRSYFGDYAGYAQEYIFHAARNQVLEV